MSRKLVLLLALTVFIGLFSVTLEVQKVKASGTIYIRADGSIDPPTAPIQRDGDVYTLTGDIHDSIEIQRDNTILDGAGYTVFPAWAISLRSTRALYNITIKNMENREAACAIYLFNASSCNIYGNNITDNHSGIELYGQSNNNKIYENNIKNNTYVGIQLTESKNNNISGNNVINNEWGINIGGSSNIISGNMINGSKYNLNVKGDVPSHLIDASNLVNGKPVYYLVNQKDLVINPPTYPQVGYLALINSINITVEDLTLTKNGQGVLLYNTNNSRIVNSNIINNYWGISQAHLSNNVIQGNNITNNWVGIRIYYSLYNSIVGNSITNNDGDGIRINNDANNNTVSGNNIANNAGGGIDIRDGSSGTTVSRNNITNNGGWGVHLDMYLDGKFYHNNFINNTIQVHGYIHTSTVWDDGYPSGGNYWSDYTGEDANGDGIGDTPYVVYINPYGNIVDRYPLMNPWTPPEHELLVSITALASLPLGSSSSLDAIVTNQGSSDEANVELMLLINGTIVGLTTIPLLQAGGSYTLSYLWTPTDEGTYNVTAYAHPVPGETSVENNQKTAFITVVEVQIGVKAGRWIKITYTITGWPAGQPYPEWLKVEFLSVEGTSAIVRVTMRMSDGTEQNATVPVDVVAGGGEAFGLSGFVIPANLTVGDTIFMSGYGNVTIEGETTRTYAGASRTVVHASISQYGTQLTYYWDKQTGVLVEASGTSDGMTFTAKATETNMWEAAPPLPFWMQWWLWAIVAVVIVALAGAVYFLKKRKSPTPTAPLLPTEGT